MTQIRNCSDSLLDQKQEFCEDLNVVDKKKICAAYNNYCIETYSTCENYTENVEKSKCEAIIPENYYSVKCVYDSENGKCITENLECSSFDIEIFKYYCDILGKEINKNCVYSDGFCLEKIPSINSDDTDKEITSINIDDTDKETTNIIIDDSDKKTTNIIIDDTKKETTNNIIDDTKKEATNINIDDTKKEATNIIIDDTKNEIDTSDLGRIDLPKITLLILCLLF